MSVRRTAMDSPQGLHPMVMEIESRRAAEGAVGAAAANGDVGLTFESLTPHERQAASLGVSPDAWKPISFMNDAHYEALLKSNSLASSLAQKLESFKHVAAGGS